MFGWKEALAASTIGWTLACGGLGPAADGGTGPVAGLGPATPSASPDGGAGGPAAAARGGDALVLQRKVLKDPGSGNMDAFTLLVPHGWVVEGGAWWPPPQAFRIFPSRDVKVTAPDGRRVHVGPTLSFSDFRPSQQAIAYGVQPPPEGGIDGGRPILRMPEGLDAWRRWVETRVIPENRPGATDIRVVSFVQDAAATAALDARIAPIAAQAAQQAAQMRSMGLYSDTRHEGFAYETRFTYTLDGVRYEEQFAFGVTVMGFASDVGWQLLWTLEPNVAFRAREGELDAAAPLLLSLATSIQPTPQWSQMLSQHAAKMGQIDRQGAAARSRIQAQASSDVGDILFEGYRKRSAMQDAGQQALVDGIREVTPYRTNDGGEVRLPAGYGRVFGDGQGNYLLTDDALYQPGADLGLSGDWSALEPTR